MTDISRLDQLHAAARKFAYGLKPGDIIGLCGELGAGKTTFVKEVARALGIYADVISPTFVYQQQYELPTLVHDIERLAHLDLYRLHGDDDLTALGIEVDDLAAATLIEWIEHAPTLRARSTRLLCFTLNPDGTRQLTSEER